MLVAVGGFPGSATDEPTTTQAPSTTTPPTSAPENETTTTAAETTTTLGETTTTVGEPTTTTAQSTSAPSTSAPAGEATTTTAAGPATTGVDQDDRQRVDAAEIAKAREVDAANAELTDLTNALVVLRRGVNNQAAEVDYANEQLAKAERVVEMAAVEAAAAQADLEDLEVRVGEMAVRAFIDDEGDQALLFAVDDPTKAMRMDVMRAQATQTDLQLVDELRRAQEDLDVRRAEALNAVDAAEQLREETARELLALQSEQAAQSNLTAAAEDRLDHLLTERAALATLGAEVDNGGADTAALVAQLAATPPSTPTAPVTPPSLVTEDDIAYAGNGIYVNLIIVEDIRRLLIDAAAAGVELEGGGYRSPASQIATRRANCGTTNYAIYEMPSSSCSPPTARPGRSMHEQGLAVDFTSGGRLIRSRSGSAWNWLAANAARYGLKNLPSEPWHWSTNGR